MFHLDFDVLKLLLGRDYEDEIWSKFVWELVIWPKEVSLVTRTQHSGPLCLWQCFVRTFQQQQPRCQLCDKPQTSRRSCKLIVLWLLLMIDLKTHLVTNGSILDQQINIKNTCCGRLSQLHASTSGALRKHIFTQIIQINQISMIWFLLSTWLFWRYYFSVRENSWNHFVTSSTWSLLRNIALLL